MYKNYLKTAIRSLLKNKAFTFINVIGLAIGISAAMVIYLVVTYDFSFDKFEPNGKQVYRVVSQITFQGEVSNNSGTPIPLHKTISTVSGLKQAVAFRIYSEDVRVKIPLTNTAPATFKSQDKIIACDKSYFNLIPHQWLTGSAAVAFNEPNRVVLTQSRAKLYFPDLQPAQILNKTIVYDDSLTTSVSGIVADTEANTDFNFHDFISLETFKHNNRQPSGGDIDGGYEKDSWGSTSSYDQLFIELLPQTTVEQTQNQLNALYKRSNKNPEPGEIHRFVLQPLSNLHFNADYDNFNQRIASKSVLYSLLGVAAFLLLLGCINFINLTTAQSAQRAREIGVRKTIGGTRQQLIGQFLTETFLLTLVAAVVSAGLSYFLLQLFSGFIPKGVVFTQIFSPGMLLFMLLLITVVSITSGLYPAFVMSGYRPVQVLKGAGKIAEVRGSSFSMRKSLTVSQFVIAQFFIMATILVSNQISYLFNKDLGFKKDAILYIRTPYNSVKTNLKQVYLDKVRAIPGVDMVSMASDAPSSSNTHSTTFAYNDGKTKRETNVELKYADTSYLKVYNLKLLAGRNLQAHDTTGAYIINQTYSKFLGFTNPQQAIGKMVNVNNQQVAIIGVVADFYQKSLHYAIKPAAIAYNKNSRHARNLHIALQPHIAGAGNWKAAISKMETAWHEVYPDDDFEYRFVNDSIARFYRSEQDTGKLLKWATGLSVLISCLGLLGLAIYTSNQRTKEIGIRKVMGATVTQIVLLLSADFVKLILIAFAIAVPIAWYFMNNWLQDFAYHTSINIGLFAGTVLATITVALLTMSMQTIKAAIVNPVKSLRSE
ncbi:ABC transporter permease [Mucilaginibacter terrae]|uniref:ABC transport system permease protein n=1 Tax=Mucilaginibacter terrae TaxID=1955052 RepID=A0ABU3GZF9_9SPHI|nr:ABC transporter permease [Mucilaginibacter terrae]MDT3405154.1 putative ABC transport system permease protein [Mucilaginibacter terrae]